MAGGEVCVQGASEGCQSLCSAVEDNGCAGDLFGEQSCLDYCAELPEGEGFPVVGPGLYQNDTLSCRLAVATQAATSDSYCGYLGPDSVICTDVSDGADLCGAFCQAAQSHCGASEVMGLNMGGLETCEAACQQWAGGTEGKWIGYRDATGQHIRRVVHCFAAHQLATSITRGLGSDGIDAADGWDLIDTGCPTGGSWVSATMARCTRFQSQI